MISNLGDGIGTVAYPWLASAVTRNPLLISLVPVAGRLPWLVFSLPAGVITDRVDRRRLMVSMDACRFALAAVVALAVLARQGSLPGPEDVSAVVGTEWVLFTVVVVATLLLGMAEVLRDNAAQTIMPAIVPAAGLEQANGRLWSAEGVANTFAGPPFGSLLLAASFALPFVVDAATFLAAAVLVAMIPGSFRATRPEGVEPAHWRAELREGVGWLWRHELLRPMAIILGVMNAAGMVSLATFVLFAQEVLEVGPLLFTVLSMGGAIGGIVGGAFASAISRSARQRHVPRPDPRRLGGGRVRDRTVELVAGRVRDVHCGLAARHPVERHHRQPAPDHHPAAPARPSEQRLPLLRLGHDAGRRGARRRSWWSSSTRSPAATSRCGPRGSSTARSTSCCSSSDGGS